MDEDYSAMSDPDFLTERRRVREELEHTPEPARSPRTSSSVACGRARRPA